MNHSVDTQTLSGLLKGRVCVLGVGNRERSDDGCGSILAERLSETLGKWSIDAGMVPENYLEKAVRLNPDSVLIIDAVDFDGVPGEARFLTPEDIATAGISTHALSLGMAAEYLSARTNARLAILAIQPVNLDHGTGLSEKISRSVLNLYELLLSFFNETRSHS